MKRINNIITQFLQYAKPLELQKSEVIIEKFFENIYQLYKAQAKQNNVSFEVIGNANIIVKLDPELFKQTIMNIIQNAFDAVGQQGSIIVKYTIEQNDFIVEISDSGNGILQKDIDKIFDLYFTTKKEGNGLGLSISQKIISQHNGLIEVRSTNSGTTFKIVVPKS